MRRASVPDALRCRVDDPSPAGPHGQRCACRSCPLDGETLADPIEARQGLRGRVAKINAAAGTASPGIHSSGTRGAPPTSAIRSDPRKRAIEKAPADESARKFVCPLSGPGDLAADEFETLRDIAAERQGPRGIGFNAAMMKAARHTAAEQKAKEDRWRRGGGAARQPGRSTRRGRRA